MTLSMCSNFSPLFMCLVTSKQSERLFQIFVAFSEYLNFMEISILTFFGKNKFVLLSLLALASFNQRKLHKILVYLRSSKRASETKNSREILSSFRRFYSDPSHDLS